MRKSLFRKNLFAQLPPFAVGPSSLRLFSQSEARSQLKPHSQLLSGLSAPSSSQSQPADAATAPHFDNLEAERIFFKSVLDLAPNNIYIFDLTRMSHVYMNQSLGKFLGYSARDLEALGEQSISATMHPDDLPFFHLHLKDFDSLQAGQVIESECRVKHADGTWHSVSIRETPFARSAEGRVTQILGIAQDINEYKKVQTEISEDQDDFKNQAQVGVIELALSKEEIEHQGQLAHSIFMNAPALAAVIRTSDQAYTLVNPNYARMHGNRNLLGMKMRDAHPELAGQGYFEFIDEVCTSGQVKTMNEFPIRWIVDLMTGEMKDGFFNITFKPLRNRNGESTELLIFAVDVTDQVVNRNKVEGLNQVLAKSEFQFRTLSESIPQIVWMTDNRGVAQYFNPTWFKYTGLPEVEVSESDWANVIHPEDLGGLIREFSQCIEQNRPFQAHYRIKRADGTFRWHLGRSVAVENESGVGDIRIGFATDIHDQIEAQETIHLLKQRTDSVIQDAPILLWAVDAKGIFTFYDGKVAKMIGICAKDRIGVNILEIYKSYPVHLHDIQRALAGEVIVGFSQLNGIYLETKFTPQFDSAGIVTGVVGLSVDITQKKKAEDERAEIAIAAQSAIEASKLKSEFLASMSHEIRTPINGVLGTTGLLLDTQMTAEQRDFANVIQRSGESLLTVVNDILDFSKIEAGKLDFEEAPFNLNEIFLDLQQTMRFSAEKKGLQLSLELELEADVPLFVAGDSGRFRQVLLNLVGNSIKFTKSGTIQIRARLQSRDEDGCVIRVEVEDSGIGIPLKTLNRLFQPFVQADSTTARKYGGSGLGLSICKGLIERMGGKIGALSEQGVGTTFWFTCGFKNAEVPQEVMSKRSSKVSNDRPGARILIAEDNPVNQMITSRMLEKYGFRSDIAANGIEALDALRNLPYDLILMDCQMPEMDGYEATRMIRKSQTLPNPHIPIIAMTANAMRGDSEKCIAAGMDDYVSKPVKAERLVEIIRKHLETVQIKRA